MSTALDLDEQLEAFRSDFEALRREVMRRVVAQPEAIEAALTALTAGGHLLLEGIPGTGKTLLARTLAEALDLSFRRIQCTPDLMPTDLIGTYVIMETPQGRRTFEFQRGPLFANIVLADHVNRTTPKTQSAFLEAMEEEAITVSTESFSLPKPFLVMATQNPWEMEGTYPLPEAEVDRFLLKAVLRMPDSEAMEQVLERTTESEQLSLRKVLDGERIQEMQGVVRLVRMDAGVRRAAVALASATHPDNSRAPDVVRRFVRHGAGPRGVQSLVLAAKVRAIVAGRGQVALDDLRGAVRTALRHRVILNFEGVAENIPVDTILDAVLESLAQPCPATTTSSSPAG